MKITLWRGYHSADLKTAVASAWFSDDLLIVCPPLKEDLSFVDLLPASDEITLGGSWFSGAHDVLEARVHKMPANSMDRPRYPAAPVLGVFTSGTISGTPRLVLYSREIITASLDAILKEFDQDRITSIFSYPQAFHTFGLLLGYALSLKLKVPLYTPDGKYGRAAHGARAKLKDPGLLTLGAPIHFLDLLNFTDKGAYESALAPSYSCIIGGAPVSKDLWHRIQTGLRIEAPSIGYGCTEASPGITHLRAGLAPKDDAEIGFPLKSLAVADVTAAGVRIAGRSVCLAIIENGQVSFPSEVLIRDGIRVRETDGAWIYQGRLDLVLNRGGVKHSLETIERALENEFHVAAFTTTVPHPRLGEELAVFIRKEDLSKIGENGRTNLIGFLARIFEIKPSIENIYAVDEFPMNESAKVDRVKLKYLAAPAIAVTELFEAMPHRPPMVWIDEVFRYDESERSCRVTLKSDALYMTDDGLRPSSYIEFMAQSFGYLSAAQKRIARSRGESVDEKPVTKAFLVSVTNAKLGDATTGLAPRAGERLTISIDNLRFVGPITLFDGRVKDETGRELARASLKVYSE